MAGNISRVEAMNAYNATANASDKMEKGTKDIQSGEERRKSLDKKIKDMQAEVARLQEEIKEKSGDKVGLFFAGLFGGDCGLGEKGEQSARAGAEMKKAAEELRVTMAQVDALLQELQGAQQDVGSELSQQQKHSDERTKVVQGGGA